LSPMVLCGVCINTLHGSQQVSSALIKVLGFDSGLGILK
jgi:hypothetical protein